MRVTPLEAAAISARRVSSIVRSISVCVASSRSSRVTATDARSEPLVTSTSARSRWESDCLTSSACVSRSASA